PSIDVIGRFEVRVGGETRAILGCLQRRLLSLLVLRSPQWTSPDVLSEALWPGSSSCGSESRLHLQVHRMRARLGRGAIRNGPDGYRLTVPRDAVDVWRFETAVAGVLADHFRGRGDSELLHRLERAVDLWTGTPFPEVEHADVNAERHRLEEMYLLAQETRFTHLLDRGEHEAALDVIAPVAAEHVTRASLRGQWMTASHRGGSSSPPGRSCWSDPPRGRTPAWAGPSPPTTSTRVSCGGSWPAPAPRRRPCRDGGASRGRSRRRASSTRRSRCWDRSRPC